MMIIPMLYWAISIACWAYALRHGGKPARWAFVLYLIQSFVSGWATWPTHSDGLMYWRGLNVPLFANDTALFVGFYILALRTRIYWPIWITGVQLMAVLTHFGPLIDPNTNAKIYRGLETFWALPIYAALVLGISKDRRISSEP